MKNNSFKAQVYYPCSEIAPNSDIESINYANDKLVIRLARSVDDQENVHGLTVTFREVTGFRLLDEADLVRYWTSNNCPGNSHLLEVTNGGWAAEENFHQGYELTRREWLVITGNRCINVFCFLEPEWSNTKWKY